MGQHKGEPIELSWRLTVPGEAPDDVFRNLTDVGFLHEQANATRAKRARFAKRSWVGLDQLVFDEETATNGYLSVGSGIATGAHLRTGFFPADIFVNKILLRNCVKIDLRVLEHEPADMYACLEVIGDSKLTGSHIAYSLGEYTDLEAEAGSKRGTVIDTVALIRLAGRVTIPDAVLNWSQQNTNPTVMWPHAA